MGWNDVKNQKGEGTEKKEIKYLPTKEGLMQIRVLDEAPFSRYTHWIPAANAGKGTSVNCIGRDTCPICKIIAQERASGNKKVSYTSRKMHAINVINRETNEVNILDKGNKLFEQLLAFYEELGDLRNFDVKLKVAGTGKDMTYAVIPMAQKPLTKEELALEKYDLESVNPNLTPEQIQMLMQGKGYKDIFGTADTNIEETVDTTETEEELEVDFTKQ